MHHLSTRHRVVAVVQCGADMNQESNGQVPDKEEERKARLKEYKKQWARDNPDKVKASRARSVRQDPEDRRAFYLKNKERIDLKNKQYQKEHQEKIQAWSRDYYRKNRDKQLEEARARYAANREEKLVYAKAYRSENRDLINKQRRESEKRQNWRKERRKVNLEHIRARERAWRLKNKDHVNAYRKSHHTPWRLKREYGLSLEKYQEMLDACHGKCPVCQRLFNQRAHKPVVDHCHGSRIVRGIICNSCNTAEGLLSTPAAVLKLYEYMMKFELMYEAPKQPTKTQKRKAAKVNGNTVTDQDNLLAGAECSGRYQVVPL